MLLPHHLLKPARAHASCQRRLTPDLILAGMGEQVFLPATAIHHAWDSRCWRLFSWASLE